MRLPAEYAAGLAVVVVFHHFQLSINITYLFPYLPVATMSFKKYMKNKLQGTHDAIYEVLVCVLWFPNKVFMQAAKIPRPPQISHMILKSLHS